MGDWVTIIHPEHGGTGVVHRGSLAQHYAAGWRLLTEDEVRDLEPPPPEEPEPMTREQAAGAAAQAETEPREM